MASIKHIARKENDIKDVVYSDVKINFDIHPNKKDVTRNFNEEAIKRSVKNIVLTGRGEKLMNPLFGCDMNSLLFEVMSPSTEEMLKEHIVTAITNFEPRAKLIGVTVSALYDMNAYGVTIVFSSINKREPITLELLINRVR